MEQLRDAPPALDGAQSAAPTRPYPHGSPRLAADDSEARSYGYTLLAELSSLTRHSDMQHDSISAHWHEVDGQRAHDAFEGFKRMEAEVARLSAENEQMLDELAGVFPGSRWADQARAARSAIDAARSSTLAAAASPDTPEPTPLVLTQRLAYLGAADRAVASGTYVSPYAVRSIHYAYEATVTALTAELASARAEIARLRRETLRYIAGVIVASDRSATTEPGQ